MKFKTTIICYYTRDEVLHGLALTSDATDIRYPPDGWDGWQLAVAFNGKLRYKQMNETESVICFIKPALLAAGKFSWTGYTNFRGFVAMQLYHLSRF